MTLTGAQARAASHGAGAETLLEVRDLVKHFPLRKGLLKRTAGQVRAVDGVSFSIGRGETLGLVGESGSGKSTVARLVLRLLRATSGTVHFDGRELTRMGSRQLKPLRQRMQIVFQDPFSSLDPRMRILDTVGEPLQAQRLVTGTDKRRRVVELLELVGLSATDLHKYPHQFSGGQAQRVAIARALATRPDLIVCDEAVSSLDVSVQAQVLNLLRRLQIELGLSYLFVAHDLNVVRYISDRISVMYLGEIIEQGPSDALMADPRHPYTETLINAIASADVLGEPRRQRRIMGRGEVPSPSSPPTGCRFHTRCPYTFKRCSHEPPEQRPVGDNRRAACHLHVDTDRPGETGVSPHG